MFEKIQSLFRLFFFDTPDNDFCDPEFKNKRGRIEYAVNEVGEKVILEFENLLYMDR